MGISKSTGVKFSNVENLGAMIEQGAEIQVICTEHCADPRFFTGADLEALAARVGRAFDLYNRRCPCRFTPGCRGWNTFHYRRGVYRPLCDPATSLRWASGPRYSRD